MPRKCLTSDPPKSVSSLSEKGLIAKVCACFAPCLDPSPRGPGDDCAVIFPESFGGRIVSTSDAVILGRHFGASDPGRLVGRKAMNRNISDVASMGGTPRYAMTSAIMGPDVSLEWLEDFCLGMRDAAAKYGVKFIGGDIARGPSGFFSMHVCLLGDAKRPLLRSGAAAGDSVYVTGPLGGSFESGRHLDFEPRVGEGLFLAGRDEVSACTDISDGLAFDLKNMLAPGLCAELCAASVPVAGVPGNTLAKALSDGEDYELLFAAAPSDGFLREYSERFGRPPFEVGKIKTAPEPKAAGAVFINENGESRVLNLAGYSHF